MAHAAGLVSGAGVVIASIEPDSPAAHAGLEQGDVVLSLGGEAVTGVDDIVRHLTGETIGQSLALSVLRRGEVRHATVVPVERKTAGDPAK